MHRIVVIASVMAVIGLAAFAGDSIKSPCGHAVAPENADTTGAVCVSVCSPGFAFNGCTAFQALVAPATSEGQVGPAPAIEFLLIRIYGDNLSVAELAVALERATGWTTEVPSGLGSEKIRPARKRLGGSESRSLRFRLQQGGKVLVNVDEGQKKFAILRL